MRVTSPLTCSGCENPRQRNRETQDPGLGLWEEGFPPQARLSSPTQAGHLHSHLTLKELEGTPPSELTRH